MEHVDPIKQVMDQIIRSEYGGCHPKYDDPCYLKARFVNHIIEVFVVGKWRGIRRYAGSAERPIPKKIVDEVISVVRMNTGGTFLNKTIILKWEKV